MRTVKEPMSVKLIFVMVVVLAATLCVCPVTIEAQIAGNNTVYDQNGNCCSGSSGSYAFVDARAFDGGPAYKPGDVCADIYIAYGNVRNGGPMAVIDARGIAQPSGGFTCTATPWTVGTTNKIVPAVVLLPAGTILIGAPWVLPDKTRVIGQGADPTASGTGGTILQAISNTFPSNAYMLQFGSSSCPPHSNTNTCDGIGVEDLTLDANSVAYGIQNQYSQERTYVNHISFRNFTGIGLDLEVYGYPSTNSGQDSGPYSNITFIGTGSSAVCARILGDEGTRGIHGLKCIGSGGTAGIYLAADGNSIEDVYVDGFTDGIEIGYDPTGGTQATAGNVVLNITGGPNVTNVVHICGNFGGSCVNDNVPDLTVLQVHKNASQPATAIRDEETPGSSNTQPTEVTDSYVAIYAVGDSAGYGGISRFTTATQSTNVPTWLVGGGPASTSPASCTNQNGTLYSNNASGSYTLYVCVAGAWTPII